MKKLKTTDKIALILDCLFILLAIILTYGTQLDMYPSAMISMFIVVSIGMTLCLIRKKKIDKLKNNKTNNTENTNT